MIMYTSSRTHNLFACWRYSVLDHCSVSISVRALLLAAGFEMHIFHCWAVHTEPWGVFECPTRAAVVWCTRQSEGVWAGQKQGSHSASILGSSALQKGWSVFKWHCSRNRLLQADGPIPACPSLPNTESSPERIETIHLWMRSKNGHV